MSKITPFEVNDNESLFKILAADVSELRFLRELLQNSIEAESTEIFITLDKEHEEKGIFKMSFVDNGCGMSGDELEMFIGQLSSGKKQRGPDKNYGIGAKIACAVQNPEGVRYCSWVEGDREGVQLTFMHDEEEQRYGPVITPIVDDDGRTIDYSSISQSSIKMPEIIATAGHGTCVTLFGKNRRDDTFFKPPSSEKTVDSMWIVKQLNDRYLTFPEGVRIKADAPKHEKNKTFIVKGKKHYLNHYKSDNNASGSVHLTGATAHWWLMKDEGKERESQPSFKLNTSYVNCRGHFGYLHHNEIYNVGTIRTIREFGLLSTSNRVVIYIEPLEAQPNMAREILQNRGEPLPLENWQQEFLNKMPEKLKEAEAQAVTDDSIMVDTDAIRKRISKSLERLPLPPVLIEGDEEEVGGGDTPGPGPSPGPKERGPDSGPSGGGGCGTGPTVKKATLGQRERTKSPLEVQWIKSPEEIEQFKGMAGEFILITKTVRLNRDYYLFQELFRAATLNKLINEEVVWATIASETAARIHLGMETIKRLAQVEQRWQDPKLRKQMSEEPTFTTIIEAARYDIMNSVVKTCGVKGTKAFQSEKDQGFNNINSVLDF